MKTTTRRNFLMSSALGAAGITGLAQSQAAEEKPSAPKQTYRLTREIPVEEGYDLIVAGGGPAGVAAAVCAARLGAKVLLVEAAGSLGGMGTNGLGCNW